MARPGSNGWLVNGDQVRDTTFLTVPRGYDMTAVDDLLGRVAAGLDAGRPVGPLIANATFRARTFGLAPLTYGYDADSVDWFLNQLLLRPGRAELARMSADPWRDLTVVNQFARSGIGDHAGRSARQSRRAVRKHFSEECMKAWHDFDQQPGVCLRWGWVGMNCRELHTMDMRTIASVKGLGRSVTVSTGRRNFTLKETSTARSASPGIAEIIARTSRDCEGHFAVKKTGIPSWGALDLRELVDETGKPILYASGRNFYRRAYASISFPDQRWLRFLVRGTESWNAIMTAVDQVGSRVARYRIGGWGRQHTLNRSIVEVTVHPGWELTDELVLAIAISAPWLGSYFSEPSGGG